MDQHFPELFSSDELTNMQLLNPTIAKDEIAARFILLLADIYLETGVPSHVFRVLYNPESTSPGSGQVVEVKIEITDNFS